MTGSVVIWIVVGLAFVAANLPFLYPPGRKGFGWRLLGVFALYLVVGGLSFLLEKNAYASIYTKGWQFYVATFCMFLVFAFPGFVYCYLWRGNRRRVAETPHGQE
jgi:hypothetical protein